MRDARSFVLIWLALIPLLACCLVLACAAAVPVVAFAEESDGVSEETEVAAGISSGEAVDQDGSVDDVADEADAPDGSISEDQASEPLEDPDHGVDAVDEGEKAEGALEQSGQDAQSGSDAVLDGNDIDEGEFANAVGDDGTGMQGADAGLPQNAVMEQAGQPGVDAENPEQSAVSADEEMPVQANEPVADSTTAEGDPAPADAVDQAADGAAEVAEPVPAVEAGAEDTNVSLQANGAIASGVWGTCAWLIDGTGMLAIHGGTGADIGKRAELDAYFTFSLDDPVGVGPWSGYADSITSVKCPDGSGSVKLPPSSSGLFSGLSRLVSVETAGFDTSRVTDMRCMFADCQKLASLDLSSFNTSRVTDMAGMFLDCLSLASLDVSSFDTSRVGDMFFMFAGCGSLKTLDVSGFNTSLVADMCEMFAACGSLVALDVSGFDTSRVTDMAGMFSGCGSLTSLDLSSFDTSQVTDMREMFHTCEALTSLDLTSFDTSKVEDMVMMFFCSDSLESLDLSSFETSSVTNFNGMLWGCRSLKSISLGRGFCFTGDGTASFENGASSFSAPFELVFDDVDAHHSWWSTKAKRWLSYTDIRDKRSGIADTYTKYETGSWSHSFEDVAPSDWFDEWVHTAADMGIITGYTNPNGTVTHFGPNDKLTRGQVATILWRASGSPSVAYSRVFSDVPSGQYYSTAVIWCYKNGIVTGYTGTSLFGTENDVTREQLATMMYRYAKYRGADVSASTKAFASLKETELVSSWAKDAMVWCADQRIITGVDIGGVGYLQPQESATRAQMAKIAVVVVRDVLGG